MGVVMGVEAEVLDLEALGMEEAKAMGGVRDSTRVED